MNRRIGIVTAVTLVMGSIGCHKKHTATTKTGNSAKATPTPAPIPSPEPVATPTAGASSPPLFGCDVLGTLRETWFNLRGKTKPLADVLSGAIDEISEEDERALGQATALEIIRTGGGLLVKDDALLQYVNRVGNLVAQHGARRVLAPDGKPRVRSRDFVFGILDDDTGVNAFSTPGGYVFVTSGLLRDLGSESDLAWVLGHEIGHVDLEHNLKALKIYLRERAVAESFANVLGDTNSRERWKNSTFFQGMASKSAEIARTMNGKSEEREADAVGLEYAVAAGYDAQGATRVLESIAALAVSRHSPLAGHDPPLRRRNALSKPTSAAIARHGYAGKIGASRFSTSCIERLDAIRAAKK